MLSKKCIKEIFYKWTQYIVSLPMLQKLQIFVTEITFLNTNNYDLM